MFQLNRIRSKNSVKPPKLEQKIATKINDTELSKWQEQNNDNIAKFLKKAKEGYNGLLVPEIDHKSAKFNYRILRELEGYDAEFLDKLTNLGLLDKLVNNKFLICPEHKTSFLLSVRISCPKCSSINVEKLNLLEHRTCGFISEKKHFINDAELKCPSCKKAIQNQEKEIRLPASWYLCNDCKDKFDEAKVNLHCNEFDHDFTANQADSIVLYNYALSDDTEKSTLDHGKLKEELAKIFAKHSYAVTENDIIKGKSGIDQTIDIVGIDGSGQSIFVFINNMSENSSEVDSKLIQILDTAPKSAILVGFSSISEMTKSIASKYNLSIISSQNIDEIISEVQKIVSAKSKKPDGDKST
jgi:transposase-like protein